MRIPPVLLVLVLCPVAAAFGQGAITDPPATFTIGAGHFDTTPDASFTGVSTPTSDDNLFEEGWWYRIAGDASETAFPAPTSQNYTGNTATITWANVNGDGFAAQKVWTVTNTGGPSGHAIGVLTLTNNNAGPLDIDVFHMVDFDVQPTAGDDSATLVAANSHISITDPAGDEAEYRGLGANAFLVRPFGDPNDVAGQLSDANVDNFDNSGLPFGPADFTGGFQWTTVSIPPGGQQVYTVILAVNTAAVPVELLGFAIE